MGFDRTQLLEPHPDIEVLVASASPTGRARHAYETARLTVRDGVDSLRFDAWPRVPVMLESYELFRALRAEGVIPAGQRFQVNFPSRPACSPALQGPLRPRLVASSGRPSRT